MRLKFKWIFTLLLAFTMQFSFAQEKTVTGVVSDKTGSLPGANVVVKGTNRSAQTDFDGKYSIQAKAGEVLVFSFIGYNNATATVGASNVYSVVLTDGVVLDEVVVMGYQTKKQSDVIGSVVTVTKDQIGDQRITNVGEALAGFTGVTVVNTSGQPGSSPTIRLRGPASLNGSQDPLIILDGAEFKGNLNAINFDDLESYSVLKDADAVAIYGNRGAKGVIVMTTKRGKNKGGKAQFNVGMSYGYSDKALDEYDYVNAEQMMSLIWTAQKNSFEISGIDSATAGVLSSQTLLANTGGYNPYGTGGVSPIDENGNVIAGASIQYDTDWWDIITQTGIRQDVNVSISGASDKTKYFLSGSFLDQDGAMIESKFKRAGGRMNLDTELRDWVNVGASMNFAQSNSNVPAQAGTSFSNGIGFSRSVSNIYPLYTRDENADFILDANGNQILDWGDGANGGGTRGFFSPNNPVWIAENNINSFDRTNMDVSPYIEFKLADGLKLKSQYSYSFYLLSSNTYQDPRFGPGVAVEGRSTKSRNTTETWTWFNTLNYDKRFKEKHGVSAMLGYEMFDNTFDNVTAEKTGFPIYGLDELVNGATPTNATTSVVYQNRLTGFFARADYDYDKRYYIGGSIRRDASSRFIDDNRWATNWSAAVAWNVKNESFLKDSSSLSALKFRASYGTVGNEDIGGTSAFLFPYFGANGVGFNIGGDSGVVPTRNANPDLTWEIHTKANFGVDFGFFNNRLTGTFEVYDTKVTDMIYQKQTPPSENSGLPTWVNSAEMTNKGWELELNSVNVRTQDFTWTTSLSASTVSNEIDYIEDEQLQGVFNWETGKSRYEFYMQEWAGVDSANGKPLWYKDVLDVDGNPTGERETTSDYAEATRYYTGKNALSKLEGRFANVFKYKNFDMNVVFFYRFGNYVYNTDYAGLMHGFHGSNPGQQLHPDIYNAWQQPGDETNVPRLSLDNDQSNSTSTRWLQDGDFVRLRTLSLGYSMSPKVLEAASIAALRFYVTADNYFTWKKSDQIDDPEQSYSGQTANGSTTMKTISFGLNISL
jgi:TonB-linked SusC/RagA family outer membrane protein